MDRGSGCDVRSVEEEETDGGQFVAGVELKW